jgi:hypothetical protein
VTKETRTLLNNGKRAFHVKPDEVIKGGELSNDSKVSAINSGATVVVTAKLGDWLLNNFPFEIKNLSPKED